MGRRLRLALSLLLVASLCWRDTRELQISLLQVLISFPGQRTVAHGQQAGPTCCVTIDPEVEFSRAYRDQLRDASGRSVDDFLLAEWNGTFPPVTAWDGHSLVEWGALKIAIKLVEPDPVDSAGPAAPGDRLIPEALDVVRLAQMTAPENGALWLAEALLLFETCQDQVALQALEVAASRPSWSSLQSRAFLQSRDLMIARGLPAFDATLGGGVAAPGALSGISNRLARQLDRMVAEAVAARDEGKVADLLMLWARLRHARAPMHDGFFWFPSLDGRFCDAAFSAMAAEGGQSLPAGWQSHELRGQAEHQVRDRYVRRILGPEWSAELLADEAPYFAEIALELRKSKGIEDRVFTVALQSSLWGSLSLLLLTITLACVLAEFPCALIPTHVPVIPRKAWFWLLLALCGLMGAWLLFNCLRGGHGLEDLCARGWPPPVSLRNQIVASTSFFIGLSAIRLMLRKWRGVFRAGIAVLFLAYLSAVAVLATQRRELIDLILAIHRATAGGNAG